MSSPAAAGPGTLDRLLGPVDAAALVVSNVIGIGIFTTPGIVAQMVPEPAAILALWIAGGILAFAGATSYAQLAALKPHAGGEYVYLREAFGPLAAFLTGWTSLVAGFSGAIAAGAVGLTAYLGHYLPWIEVSRPLLSLPLGWITLSVAPRTVVALAIISLLSAVHIRGLGPGRFLQNSLAGVMVLALLVMIAFGFAAGAGSWQHLAAGAAGQTRPGNWLLALIPVMFTYSGWNAAVYVAEEVRRPEHNVPRALALGTAVVVLLYLLLNLLYLYALPAGKLAGMIDAGNAAAEALFGARAAHLTVALMALALLGGVSAMTVAGPRVYFAMARDGLFLRPAARIHPRFRTPAAAILAQAVCAAILVLSGTFEQLLIYTGFAVVLFSGVAVLALFVLRRRTASRERPRMGWQYPLAPALFVIASLGMVVSALRERPVPSLAGMAVIAAGVPIYLWWRKRATRPA